MPRKAFFCYEEHNGLWGPVVYYDEAPTKEYHRAWTEIEHTSYKPIPSSFITDDEVNISFKQLQDLYPLDPDKQLQNESNRNRLERFRRLTNGETGTGLPDESGEILRHGGEGKSSGVDIPVDNGSDREGENPLP